jgi:hypothetical protein
MRSVRVVEVDRGPAEAFDLTLTLEQAADGAGMIEHDASGPGEEVQHDGGGDHVGPHQG